MDVEEAIRTRRTHKVYGSEPVERAVLTELLELGRWAPNHHLTNPWRFRVLGPEALERLKAAVGPDGAGKLDRAPTLVAVSVLCTPDDPVAEEEDLLAAGCAAYAVLLGAHNRGLAAYWRTPAILREPAGRAALDIPDAEHCIGLLHLGPARQEQRVPERAPLDDVVTFLA
ncbi:nitroreductase [Baekduia sp.]|jgi:nitroreductase|uniref:nitroreductase family protein n=1 Tax=Baekduia sp. TaxID=2600305 RepID=UPI002E08BC6B|nr:nitroreductase [Baekduia sp.]